MKKSSLNRPQKAADEKKGLGPFELRLITAVSRLGTAAYPAELTRHLSKALDRHVSLAQVFISLERIQEKGLVSSKDVYPPGARRRLLFRLEEAGIRAMNEAVDLERSKGEELQHYAGVEEPAPA